MFQNSFNGSNFCREGNTLLHFQRYINLQYRIILFNNFVLDEKGLCGKSLREHTIIKSLGGDFYLYNMTSYPGFRVTSKQFRECSKINLTWGLQDGVIMTRKTSLISTHLSGDREGRRQYQEHLNTLMWIIVPLNVEPSGRGLTVWRLSRPRCARCGPSSQHSPALGARGAMGRGELNGCKLCINQHQSANNLIRGNGDGDCARQD